MLTFGSTLTRFTYLRDVFPFIPKNYLKNLIDRLYEAFLFLVNQNLIEEGLIEHDLSM